MGKDNIETIGILYICTGVYSVFWKEFYESYERNFMPQYQKHYVVFTDSETIEYEQNANVHKFFQKRLGWPYDTLMRFDIFLTVEEFISQYDYLFFMNANCICNQVILDILPNRKQLVVVRHPGFYNCTNQEYTYDRNKMSQAYIPEGRGNVYVCGGVNGGIANAYIELVHKLSEMINKDLENGIIPLWHDESILNKYVYLHEDEFEIRDPNFCYPEGWNIPFNCDILIRNKEKYIDVNKIKERGLNRVKIFLSEKLHWLKNKK